MALTHEKVGQFDAALLVYKEMEHAFRVEWEAKGQRRARRGGKGEAGEGSMDDFLPVFIQVREEGDLEWLLIFFF